MSAAHETPVAGLRGEQRVAATAEQAAEQLARALAGHVQERLAMAGQAHLALSGGSSAKLLGAALLRGGYLRAPEWSRIHLWMVDERVVPEADPRCNARLIREVLAGQVPLPLQNLHPMPVLVADGADRYARELEAALADVRGESASRLDAAILGMGPDGHTASLFPGTPALDERERTVVVNDGELVVPPRPRMTMTYPFLNRARFIALLVTGTAKYAALQRAAANPEDHRALPVTGVIPAPGSRLAWFLDSAAVRG